MLLLSPEVRWPRRLKPAPASDPPAMVESADEVVELNSDAQDSSANAEDEAGETASDGEPTRDTTVEHES